MVLSVEPPLPPTPLVGRHDELRHVVAALCSARARIVTLTGPPGVGKTHLALAAAADVVEEFPDGRMFVDLARTTSPAGALGEVARVVGVGEALREDVVERIVDRVGTSRTLLLLDNCEHVLPLAGIGAVVARCPRLHVLATSREPLHLRGEQELGVAPLRVPGRGEREDPDAVLSNASVRLLVDRAQSAVAEFDVRRDNAPDVAELCVLLDGLPLALELAAAQLKVFTPAELVTRLRNRTILLRGVRHDTPPRHQSLRAALEWSHDLMPPAERRTFRRLAVFVGGWTAAAAEAVCALPDADMPAATAPTDVGAVLGGLVDTSIVRRRTRPSGVTEFSMLASLREFAAEQLAAHGEEESVRRRHAAYFVELATRAESGIGTPDEDEWWGWLGHEHGNLRAALDWSLDHDDTPAALQLAAALSWYWYTRGYVGEGRVVLDRAVRRLTADVVVPPQTDASVALACGVLTWAAGDLEAARESLGRSGRLSDAVGDVRRSAVVEAFLGHVERDRGELEAARRHYDAARQLFAARDDRRGVAWSHFDLGTLAWTQGDLDGARRELLQSRTAFTDLDYAWALACATCALAAVTSQRGDDDEAAGLVSRALDVFDGLAENRGVATCWEVVARLACGRGQYEAAGRLLGAAAAVRRHSATPGTRVEVTFREQVVEAVTAAIGRERAARATSAGEALRGSEVAAACSRVLGQVHVGDTGRRAWPTAREREIAALVAAGRTNRQIARALGISERTVEVHVHNAMATLGVRSRAEIAAWAVDVGLYEPPRARAT